MRRLFRADPLPFNPVANEAKSGPPAVDVTAKLLSRDEARRIAKPRVHATAVSICATSLAGVTREVEEEWNQRAAPPLAGDRGSLPLISAVASFLRVRLFEV